VDNLTHTLVGAAIGKAGLARRSSLGMGTLMIASNFPDIDVAVFLTPTLAMSFRRGWTHGILAQIVLPPILGLMMFLYDRWVVQRRTRPLAPRSASREGAPARLGVLIALSYIGVLGHVFMDYLNSYGVRLLMPFSQRWFYGDALYIVDPWILLFLGGGLWLTRRREAPHKVAPYDPASEKPVQFGLGLAVVYMLMMFASNMVARSTVAADLVRAGQPGVRFMVTPVIVNPFKREVVIDLGPRYEKGTLWFEPLPHFRPGGYGIDTHLGDPEAQDMLHRPRAQAFLQWSRFPFVAIDRSKSPPAIWLNDYRYANTGLAGWSATYVPINSQD
jgi:inner membrane protein